LTELLEQAAQADRAEDAHHGETRSDQLPRALAARAERLAHPSGLERLVADLDPSVPFAGDTLEVGGRGEGHRDLAGEGLVLMPSAFVWPGWCWCWTCLGSRP
jgi:hypothetical protein